MPKFFSREKDNRDVQAFKPSDGELEFLQPFLENRNIPFKDARKMIDENQAIPEERRLALGDWLREQRMQNPGGVQERSF